MDDDAARVKADTLVQYEKEMLTEKARMDGAFETYRQQAEQFRKSAERYCNLLTKK